MSLTSRISELATTVGGWLTKLRTTTLVVVIDGGGAAITTGAKIDVQVPFTCVIQSWTLLADQAGSAVVEISKNAYASWPTVAAITASAKPTLSATRKASSSSLTGWTTTITADDVLQFGINSATAVQRVTLCLKVRKS